MNIIMILLIVGAFGIAIYSAIKPAPILWVAVVLLSIVEAITRLGGSVTLR